MKNLPKKVNSKRLALASKRGKDLSLSAIAVELGIPKGTFFNVMYGKAVSGDAFDKIKKWLRTAK